MDVWTYVGFCRLPFVHVIVVAVPQSIKSRHLNAQCWVPLVDYLANFLAFP